MNEGAIRSLEFDRIVEVVQSFALTPLGAAQLATLRPQTDIQSAQAALAATTECARFLAANGSVPLDAPPDLDECLTRLAVEGLPLEAGQLRGLARFLLSVQAVQRSVKEAQGGPFPAMQTVLDGCRSFAGEATEITSKIDDASHVVDGASAELGGIRDRLHKQTNRLRGTLDSYLRGKETARYLQEQIVTERAGRHVLVVRAEHRGAIPGIIHGSSGSGASLFLEPLSTVEINNDIVALQQQETEEVRRILLELSNQLRGRALDLRHTLGAATEIDEVQARASFSRLIDGTAPELTPDPRLEFRQARHPLLIPEVRRRLVSDPELATTAPVPVDLQVTPPTSVLVVTGPNTGGKTVALKTAGLLSLMAQSGLHVPAAEGSTVTVFRSVFADIGDEQSITASVSTFSGHIKNIVAMDRRLRLPALVLLDELGAGTDPLEGGALGAALIDHFRARGAVVVATTHDEMLKTYAATTDAATCAGFGFDPKTYAPTYQLTYGAPGRSLALEIATRLGVGPTIIRSARERRSAREAQLADHLAKIDRDLQSISRERQQLAKEREGFASERAALEADQRALQTRKDAARQRLADGVGDQVRLARTTVDAVIERLRTRASEMEQTASTRAVTGRTPLTTGETGDLRAEAHAALDTIAATADRASRDQKVDARAEPDRSEPGEPLGVGTTVTVERLGLSGHVRALHGQNAEVEVRGKRLRVPLADLRAAPPSGGRTRGGRVTMPTLDETASLDELNVIGCSVDEALSRTEKYLDQAVLHAKRQVRVIHGHGTGALRRSIAGLLQTHPEVARFAAAPREQGGSGVTVVDLKD